MADTLETETIYLAIENLLINISQLQESAPLACAAVDAKAVKECNRFRFIGLHPQRLGCHVGLVPIEDEEMQFIERFRLTVSELSETVMACVRHAQTADPSGPQPPIDSMLYTWITGANEDVCTVRDRLKEVADRARAPSIHLAVRGGRDTTAKEGGVKDKGRNEEGKGKEVEDPHEEEDSDDGWSVVSHPTTAEDEDYEQLEIVNPIVPDIAKEIEKTEREHEAKEVEETKDKMQLDSQAETVSDLINKIKDRSALLTEFLPILKADINEYLSTSNPTDFKFPPSPPPDLYPTSTRYSAAPIYAPDSLQSLRGSLYNLRDELIRNTTLLSRLLFTTRAETLASSPTVQASILPPTTALEITALKDSETIASAALTRAISNNGSEWIDSALNGGLSFSEFKSLEKEEIDGFVEGLRNLSSEMEIFIGRVRSVRCGSAGVFGQVEGYRVPGLEEGDTRDGSVVKGVDVEELRWWRERVEGLNWSLKARKVGESVRAGEGASQRAFV